MVEAASPTVEVRLRVGRMSCATCAGRVRHALMGVPGVQRAEVHLVLEEARATLTPGTSLESLCEALSQAGYPATVQPAMEAALPWRTLDEGEQVTREFWGTVLSLALATPLAVPMLLHPFGVHIALPLPVAITLATLVQLVFGARFYRAAWSALRQWSTNMDVLVALGTTAAFGQSLMAVSQGSDAVYFEASAMVIALVRLGKWLEGRAKRATRSALTELGQMFPQRVLVRRGEREELVNCSELTVGSMFVARPGERLAADGVVVGGRSEVDQAQLTGESLPIECGVGDGVSAGSLNGSGRLVIQATRVGGDSTLGQLIRCTLEAQGRRAPIERLVDRISRLFIPTVLVIGMGTLLGWWLSGHPLAEAIENAVSVWVVACPCALGLATPAAVVAGLGAGARHGIVIRDAETLERCPRVDTVVFDKTGTLTQGTPRVSAVHAESGDEAELLRLLASLEAASEHPLARAIVEHAQARELPLAEPEDFVSTPGGGVSGRVDGHQLLVGSRRWLAEHGVESPAIEGPGSVVGVARDGRFLGAVVLGDLRRPSAKGAVRELQRRGLDVIILSGDGEPTVRAIAEQLDVSEWRSEMRPAEKLAFVQGLTERGRRVAMVGDGVNDAPALSLAEIGIAMGSGTDLAASQARIVLVGNELTLVAAALELGRLTTRRIALNLFWASAYNLAMIPVAVFGGLTPMLAGGAMAMSSVLVVLNSLRLRGWRPLPALVGSAPIP